MTKIGDPSSKYGYNPEQINKDVEDKLRVKQQFKADINKAIDKDYKYINGGYLSENWKRQILLEIYKDRYI